MILDDVTLKIAWSRLQAVANEVATTIFRTAFSPVVRELVDLGVAVLDADGRMLAASDIGTPGHMNPLRASCELVLSAYPAAELAPGDVLVVNDPWATAGHLLDLAVITPVFAGEDLMGFIGNICHYTDVGGLGLTTFATDIYEEGLFLPPVKLFASGLRNDALYHVVLANVRRSQLFAGDLEAAIAGNEVGVRGILRLLDDLRLSDLDAVGQEILYRSERTMRELISALADGSHTATIELDPLEPAGEPLTVCVEVAVRGDSIVVDYAGTSSQVRRGVNSTLAYTTGYTQYAVRLALTNQLPNNSGTLAPIHVAAPEGSLVNCRHPAPTAARHLVAQSLPGVVLAALAHANPPYGIADSSGPSMSLALIPDAGIAHVSWIGLAGGTGARKDRNGLTGRYFPARIRLNSVETTEQEGIVRVLRREVRDGSGGGGRHRGGDGLIAEIELCGETPCTVEVTMERTHMPPFGLFGGADAQPARAWHNGHQVGSRLRTRAAPGDRFLLESAGGGGWGSVYPAKP